MTPSRAVAGDLREGARWGRAQWAKNTLLYALARLALGAASLLPRAVARAAGAAAGALAYVIFAGARRTAHANAARALSHLPERARRGVVRRAYLGLGAELGDAARMLRVPAAPLPLTAEAREVLRAARAEGRGVVFASAHLGPWERVAAGLVAAGEPFVTVAREAYDPRFTRLYERMRGHGGVRAIYRGDAGAAARIVRALRSGGVLGMPMDLASRVPSVDVPFLGHVARTPVGPARLALRTGAAVVVGTVARDLAGALVVTATRVHADDLDAGERGERELTARINAELSRRILALPELWVWMHPRFG